MESFMTGISWIKKFHVRLKDIKEYFFNITKCTFVILTFDKTSNVILEFLQLKCLLKDYYIYNQYLCKK